MVTPVANNEIRDLAVQWSAEAIISCFEGPSALLDSDGVIVAVNDSWHDFAEDNHAGPSSDYVNVSYVDICENATGKSADGASDVAQAIRGILGGTKDSYSITYPCHSPTQRRWYKCLIRPVKQQDQVKGAIVQHVDATQEIEGRVTTAAKLELFALAAAGVGAHAWQWDLQDALIHPNESLRNLVGWDRPPPWSPDFIKSRFHPDEQARFDAQIDATLRGDIPQLDIEHRFLTGEGAWRWLRTTAIAHRDGAAHPVRMIGFSLDITTSKTVESRMREALHQAGQMALVAEKTDNSVIIANAEGEIEWVNSSFSDMTGWTLDEVIGKKPGHFLRGPATDVQASRAMDKDLKGRIAHKSEILNYRKDGTPLWVAVDVQPVLVDQQGGAQFIALQRDITPEVGRRALNTVRLEMLDHIAVDLTGNDFLAALESRITDAVRALIPDCTCSIAMLQNRQTDSAPLWRLAVSDSLVIRKLEAFQDDPGFAAFTSQITARKKKCFLNLCASPASETLQKWAHQNGVRGLWGAPLISESGQLRGAFVLTLPDRAQPTESERQLLQDAAELCADMFDRAHAATDRHLLQNRIALLAEALPVRVAFIEPDHVIRYANAGYADFHEHEREALIGKKHSDLLTPQAWEILGPLLHKALRGEGTSSELSVPYGPDRNRDVRITWIPENRADGTIGGVYKIVEDLTEFRDRERQLNHAVRASQAANQAKSRFLANMSHELRTPLNAIIGYSEILKLQVFGPIENDRYESYIKDIHNSGTFLLDLIEDVLELSRLEAATTEVDLKPCALNSLVETALRLIPAGRNRVDLSLHATGMALIDARAVKQIVINLVSNALKYGGDGRISVRTTDGPTLDELTLLVEDYGPGIAPKDLSKVTEPFYTSDQSPFKTNANPAGAGIGLAIVKRLTDEMHGSLSIESDPGHYTRVSVVLQRAQA